MRRTTFVATLLASGLIALPALAQSQLPRPGQMPPPPSQQKGMTAPPQKGAPPPAAQKGAPPQQQQRRSRPRPQHRPRPTRR